MEYRLVVIGAALLGYGWLSRGWQEDGGPKTPLQSALWHALFFFLAAASAAMILSISFESRGRFISVAAHALPLGDLYAALLSGAAAGGLGFWRAWSRGDSVESRRYYLNEDLEWADTVSSAAIIAGLLMLFVVQAFRIPSSSMERTLLIGDRLFVNKFVYGLRLPLVGRRVLALSAVERGDVVVFEFPVDDPRELHCGTIQYGKDFIKRVIGLPGDVVEVRAGRIAVNGRPLAAEPYASYVDAYRLPEPPRAKEIAPARYQELWEGHKLDREFEDSPSDYAGLRDYFGPVRVPPRSYLMMGDNRDRSCDSRYWGPVPESHVKGKAWLLYWPLSRMKLVR